MISLESFIDIVCYTFSYMSLVACFVIFYAIGVFFYEIATSEHAISDDILFVLVLCEVMAFVFSIPALKQVGIFY